MMENRFGSLSFRCGRCRIAILIVLFGSLRAADAKVVQKDSECEKAGATGCLVLSVEAMAGSARLDAIKSLSYESIGHVLLVEQSYRQDPFISAYERSKGQVDFGGNRIRVESELTWPESDPDQSEVRSTMVADAEGCVMKQAGADAGRASPDSPCSLSQIDWVRDFLSLDPLRLLPTAQQASDLHFEPAEMLRSTSHSVLAFTWKGTPVRILINRFNNLPDAVETIGQFHDHWYQWGDVRRRTYFDNWVTVQGIRYPTNQIEERNGSLWKSTQFLNLKFNVAFDSSQFEMDPKVATKGAQSKGWERPFDPQGGTELAPGIYFFAGAWNATLVKQDDGVVILEAPISGTYSAGVIAEVKRRYPDLAVKAVLSTSDSWPHVGGVRQAVAAKLPVYILDLNQPLLDRIVAAKHTLNPDKLAQAPQKPLWKTVSQKTVVGSGSNRMELYPLRGACTERQYMPAIRLP